jgi:hypothetical protein
MIAPMRRELLFSLVIATICIGLAFVDLAKIPPAPIGLHARGRVVAVDNSNVRQNLIVKTEARFLTVRLLNGPHTDQEIPITNPLMGKMEFRVLRSRFELQIPYGRTLLAVHEC